MAGEVDPRLLRPAPREERGERRRPQPGTIGLCLSGGGYRAMLFHLGALWRLNELGYLPKLNRVSSVSGGSITAAILGMNWDKLGFDASGRAGAFVKQVAEPVHEAASRSLDWKAISAGLALPGSSIGWHLTWLYRRHIFGGATLQNLPDERQEGNPRFVINATNLQSGALWRFARIYSWDYRVGQIKEPEISLAQAVAASSAFPPVLSPARFRFKASDYAPGTGEDLQKERFTTRPVLADGGVYDNLGLQPLWNSCETILISDGGGAMQEHEGALWKLSSWRWRDWGSQSVRVLAVIDNQVRDLRKRQAVESFKAEPTSVGHRAGSYWGIRSHIADYELLTSLPYPAKRTKELAETKTRLKRLERSLQEELVNWGYAISDTSLRKWVVEGAAAPKRLPYPDATKLEGA